MSQRVSHDKALEALVLLVAGKQTLSVPVQDSDEDRVLARYIEQQRERDRLHDESESEMHLRIRHSYDKGIADAWRKEVAKREQERDEAQARIAELEAGDRCVSCGTEEDPRGVLLQKGSFTICRDCRDDWEAPRDKRLAGLNARIAELEALIRWLCLHVDDLQRLPWADGIPEAVQGWLFLHQPRLQGTANNIALNHLGKLWSKDDGPMAAEALRRLGREAVERLREVTDAD